MRPGLDLPRLLMRLACGLYPRRFRELFAADMLELFAAERRRLRSAHGRLAVGLWAARTLGATVAAAIWERLRSLTPPAGSRPSPPVPVRRTGRPCPQRAFSMERIVASLVQAVRRLTRAPGFSVAAAAAIAIGVAAAVAVFALVDGILLRPLPYPEPERLVSLQHVAPGIDLPRVGQSTGTYLTYRERASSFERMGLYQRATGNLAALLDADAEPERISLALVTPSLLSTLGVRPLLGRSFTDADAAPEAPSVILLSHALWTRRYGADPDLVGRDIEINGNPRRVVGIMPSAFAFPDPEVQVWFPMSAPESDPRFGGLYLEAVGRLRSGVEPGQAEAELRSIIPSLADRYEDVTAGTLASLGLDARVVSLKRTVLGDVSRPLWVLLATSLAVLVIACANVANLFLVRAEHARKEVAVRSALGAGAGDVIRHWMAESLLIASLGGAVGMVAARWSVAGLLASGAVDLPRVHEVAVDGRVLVLGAGVIVVAGLLLGLVPVLRHRAADVGSTLRAGRRGATAGAGRQRARRLLVGCQIALALALATAAALMMRSSRNLALVDPGFQAENVLTFRLTLPYGGYERYEPVAAFYDRLLDRIRGLPGVREAGAVSQLPLAGVGLFQDPLAREDDPPAADEVPPVVNFVRMTPGYLGALGVPVRRGRPFRPDDADGEAPAVLVSESLARRLFPAESPLGKRVRRHGEPGTPPHTIVGVVGDVHDRALDEPPGEIAYLPVLQRPAEPSHVPRGMTVVVRAAVPPATLVSPVRELVRELDPRLPLASVRPMSRVVAASTARATFTMRVLAIAAGAALFLGAVGLYGVVSYAVGQRTREIGVRMALGARAGDVGRMVLAEVVATASVGVLAGLAVTAASARVLQSLLYRVSATDPLAYGLTASLLLGAALVAAWIPARRAARIDPAEALTAE